MDTKKTNLFYFRTDWKEIVWQHNTRKGFVHKQDLTAVFFNAYIDVKQKIQSYVNRKNEFPENEVNELIFEFRENFSLTGRIEGVNYFDDLILQFIDYYKANNPHLLQMKERLQNTLNKTDKENEIDLTTFKNTKPTEKKPRKDKAQYHVISFILDCYANKKQLPTGKEWEKAGETRKKYDKSGNTFYKEANKMLDKNFTKNKLSNLLGDNWRSIVLERSDDPKALKAYLNTLA